MSIYGWRMSLALATVALLFLTPNKSQAELNSYYSINGDRLIIDGLLSDEFVAKLIDSIPARAELTTLAIRSVGGSAFAGIKLGEWVNDRGLNVEVHNYCLSSCANYIFLAGKNKIIKNNSVVAWHGGAFQKNFREEYDRFISIKDKVDGNIKTDDAEESFYKSYSKKFQNMNELRKMEYAFFKKIGVLEYVVRAGQEPNFLGGFWLANANDLVKFGVCNIQQPENYGTLEYANNVSTMYKNKIYSLIIRDGGDISDRLLTELRRVEYPINKCAQ